MATIHSLKKSYSELDIDEKMALIREIRALRREPKPVKRRSSVRTARKKKKLSMDEMLNALTPEQRATLLKQLGGK
jgi:Spy/CpxP family protein refolding chaperone